MSKEGAAIGGPFTFYCLSRASPTNGTVGLPKRNNSTRWTGPYAERFGCAALPPLWIVFSPQSAYQGLFDFPLTVLSIFHLITASKTYVSLQAQTI